MRGADGRASLPVDSRRQRRRAPAEAAPLDGAGPSSPGDGARSTWRGADVLVANVDGTLLAYRDALRGCGARSTAAR